MTNTGPLAHITVLDLSRVMAGPWCTQILADLGATVVKIEHPKKGDDTRGWGPPFLKDAEGNPTSEAGYFLSANRGKHSLTCDITSEEGQKIIHALAKKSDILIENFKIGGLKKYGLAYEDLAKENPTLIYCSITGFGQTGPCADQAGYDYMIQAMGGLMSITGKPDDEPGGEPMRVGVPIADLMTGMYATTGILAALTNRNETGKGQHIDIALFDTQLAMLANQAMNYLLTGNAPGRIGNCHPNIVPYQLFHTKDAPIIVAVGNDGQFQKLCTVLECPEFIEDPRYTTNSARVEHREQLIPELQNRFETRSQSEWLAALEAQKIPCGPVLSIDHAIEHPQAQHRGMKVTAPHVLGSDTPMLRSPLHFSETPVCDPQAPPTLGQHTGTILRDTLGFSEEDITTLKKKGVV